MILVQVLVILTVGFIICFPTTTKMQCRCTRSHPMRICSWLIGCIAILKPLYGGPRSPRHQVLTTTCSRSRTTWQKFCSQNKVDVDFLQPFHLLTLLSTSSM